MVILAHYFDKCFQRRKRNEIWTHLHSTLQLRVVPLSMPPGFAGSPTQLQNKVRTGMCWLEVARSQNWLMSCLLSCSVACSICGHWNLEPAKKNWKNGVFLHHLIITVVQCLIATRYYLPSGVYSSRSKEARAQWEGWSDSHRSTRVPLETSTIWGPSNLILLYPAKSLDKWCRIP